MKPVFKILTLFFVLLFSFQAKASDLFLRLYDNSLFTVIFNQSVSSYSCRNFQMNNLAPGEYPIEIYSQCPSVNMPCGFPLYRGTVSIPAACQVLAYIDMYNRLQTGGVIQYTNSFGYSNGMFDSQSYQSYSPQWCNLMDSTGYEQAKSVLSEISSQKMQVNFLKRCIYFHGISTSRLSTLLLGFDFDTERLELATYAYGFTIDKENYYKVFDSFIFHSTRQQLSNNLYFNVGIGRY